MSIIPMDAKPWDLKQNSFPARLSFDPRENPVNFTKKKPIRNRIYLELL
jgi:hypothetical protein